MGFFFFSSLCFAPNPKRAFPFRKQKPPCAPAAGRGTGEEGTAHRHPYPRWARVRDPALGSPPTPSCTKAATYSKQIHHATERRKVRHKQKQKLTLKGRKEKKKTVTANYFQRKVGGCCAAATWDFRGCTLIACFSLVRASLLRRQKAAVLGSKKTRGGISRTGSLSSACGALLICFKDFFSFPGGCFLDLDFETSYLHRSFCGFISFGEKWKGGGWLRC